MFEKVNPSHPDKLADRIAGALVDLAYSIEETPKVAIEVLIGHGTCNIIAETSVELPFPKIVEIVDRIAGIPEVNYLEAPQDEHLSDNQKGAIRCGDNGIFAGVPLTDEQIKLSMFAREMYREFPYDGKFVLDDGRLIVCQSNATADEIRDKFQNMMTKTAEINPIGDWTGGSDVDAGATNRKLGSDMADSVTGGGLHGKDLSKADVSVNIYAWCKAQETGKPVKLSCAIGDETIDGMPYGDIVEIARTFINLMGGFEKFAEWGLV